MTPLYTYNNKLLVSNGALAASENCCCDSSSGGSGEFSGFGFTSYSNCDYNSLLNQQKNSISIEICGLFTDLGQTILNIGKQNFKGSHNIFNVESTINIVNNIEYEPLVNEAIITLRTTIQATSVLWCDQDLKIPFISVDFIKVLGRFSCNNFNISGNHNLSLLKTHDDSEPCEINANINWIIE